MKVVLSPNPYRDRGLKAAQSADRILKHVGVDTVFCLPFPIEGGSVELPKHLDFRDTQDELRSADMLVCFGGDGTILHAAKDANLHHVPILGVNLGSMGFMAELELSELSLLSKVATNRYSIENRMMLDVVVRRESRTVYSGIALNDAAITKGAVARIIDLEVYGDRVLVNNFSGDRIHGLLHGGRWPDRRANLGEHHHYPDMCPCIGSAFHGTWKGPDGNGKNGENGPEDSLSVCRWWQGL